MAKKKEVTADSIIESYMNFVLEEGKKPASVFAFAKTLGIKEAEFYTFFSSFTTLDQAIFTSFFTKTIELLAADENYQTFDERNKLLSFYFTIFALFSANRSYVNFALKEDKNSLEALKTLHPIRKDFVQYFQGLNIPTVDLKLEQLESFKTKSMSQMAWMQFLYTLKFWIDDTSTSFEKTDVFIEKSVNTSFDVLESTPLKSIIDFGKFMFKEKSMAKK